jgi:DNA (cytosine-5)-methyltransferase 1
LRGRSFESALASEPPVVSTASASQPFEWPIDPKERCDFYHRTRVLPSDVAGWRKWTLKKILQDRARFRAISRATTLETARALFDDGISRLREIARIASFLYPSATIPAAATPLSRDAGDDANRVLRRLGMYSELQLSLEGLDGTESRQLLADLLPPNLRQPIQQRLAAHGRLVCRDSEPSCRGCEFRKFCATYRERQVSLSEESDRPTAVDFFCGAGGLSEGLRRAGFRVLCALDNDPMALRTYAVNHQDVPLNRILCRDITTLKKGELKRLLGRVKVDLFAGAPPCQGFSHAGFRSKATHTDYRVGGDARNFLFEHMIDVALQVRPRMFLLENVPGMQSALKENLSFLETAARMLEDRGGFQTAIWRTNAAAHGVPQDRIRYFLVASSSDELPIRPAEEYQDYRQHFDVDALPPITLDEAIFDLPERAADDGYAVESICQDNLRTDPKYRRYLKKFGLLSNSSILYNHTVRYHNERDLELYSLLQPGEDSIHVLERHGRADLMRYRRDVHDDKYWRLRGDRPSKTIVAHLAKDGNGYVHPRQIRSISIREAARVQSFSDDYVFCGAPSDQWTQLGNAVPPLLAEKIGKSFLQAMKKG